MDFRRALTLATTSFVVLSGCSQYDLGNLDQKHCKTLRPGSSYEEIIAVMGQPLHVKSSAGQIEQTLVYNTPAMDGLPIFGADKSVEIVLAPSDFGLKLLEVNCSGND